MSDWDLWTVLEAGALGRIISLSLAVSVSATALATLFGTPLGAALAVYRFPGRQILVVTFNALLGLPPDADLVLVHDPEAEQQFIAEGHGAERREIAWNDFILVGPRADPAHIVGGRDAVAAFTAIAEARAPFVSRGDKSGPTRSNTVCGGRPRSTRPRPAGAHGTATSAAAWGRLSTRLRR